MATSVIKGGVGSISTAASNFITLNSDYSVGTVYLKRYGRLIMGRFIFTTNISIAANEQKFIGTIKEGYRPAEITGLGGTTYYGLIATNGEFYVRPYVAKTAGTEGNITFMYLLAN